MYRNFYSHIDPEIMGQLNMPMWLGPSSVERYQNS